MNIVFEFGSEFVDNEILNNFLKLIAENYQINGEAFGRFIIDTYMQTLNEKVLLADIVIKMIAWVIGEIGSACCKSIFFIFI
jgi:AP-4 complex subunit epsilon-1